MTAIKNKFILFFSVIVVVVMYILLAPMGYNWFELSHFKQYVIPFLWAILFIFLYGKNHMLIGINAYFIFLLMLFAEKLNFGPMPTRTIIVYSLISMTMVFLFTLIYQELSQKKFKVATILSYIVAFSLYVIPMVSIIYALALDTKLTKDILYSIVESNKSESLEYIHQFIDIKWISIFVFITGFIGFLLYRQEKLETEKIDRSLLLFLIIIFATLSFAYKDDLRLYMFTKNGISDHKEELKLFREAQEKLKEGNIQFEAIKNENSETYIVVIGESLNKENMGIYGYQRETTPLLTKKVKNDNILVFRNAFSNYTLTSRVFKYLLTEANQQNKMNYFDSPSLINVLNQADFETFWVTNQVLYGKWDNYISALAHEADHLIGLNHTSGESTLTQQFDGAMIEKVKKVLSEKNDIKNRVIFVHLMGSHGAYCSRFPSKYNIFKEPLAQGIFGRELQVKKDSSNSINCYDNSVLYNDWVISSLLTELQKVKGTTGFLYLSDHADDVFRGLGHDPSKFTYEMTQIPMISWFSDDYKKKYSDKYSILQSRLHALYSNDLIYDTLIGMFNIKTDQYKSLYDFTSKDYKLTENNAYTMWGEHLYTDKSNYIWWQNKNTQYLIDSNISSRVFPYRVNTVGKLKDIWQDGFRSFQIDTRFIDNSTGFFKIGQEENAMGESFETFFSSVNHTEIERIWVDIKNLNENNYEDVLKRLNYLDQKFHIKSRFIISSGATSPFFKNFKNDGWYNSYSIPTDTIAKMLNEKNIEGMIQLAEKVAQQTKNQDLSAVSFDHSLYPFIKEYLEPLILKDIAYHIRYGPNLYSTTFKDELHKDEFFLDQRVKLILVKYKSPYEL